MFEFFLKYLIPMPLRIEVIKFIGRLEAVLYGKKFAVLGARGVGKTHFTKFLTTGNAPSEYIQTIISKKIPSHKVNVEGHSIRVRESLDVSGSADALVDWKKLCAQADVIIYLFRADRVLAGDEYVIDRIQSDLNHIGDWIRGWADCGVEKKLFFFVGTHIDMDPIFQGIGNAGLSAYSDILFGSESIQRLISSVGPREKIKIAAGTMKNLDGTRALVFNIMEQIINEAQ